VILVNSDLEKSADCGIYLLGVNPGHHGNSRVLLASFPFKATEYYFNTYLERI